ncbi:phosphatase PAP2 family protein [Microtetraspora fusca]|uniref:Phosphatase PAP2 family protein n=1 Tax=Microtetraspora fusca TaxID=1997 RepID=A0ABW6VJV0_MICFU
MSPPPDRGNWRREVAIGRFSRLIEHARSGALVGGVRGRPGVLVEVIVLLLGFLFFAHFHALAGKDVASATANALALQSVERALHVDIEQMANEWLTGHPALIQPAVYYYRLYYVVLVGVLIWVFVWHADVYIKVRRTLLAMIVLVLPVFWALPMSPPRFALPGVVDIVAEYDILGSHASQGTGNGQNLYSAMPSLHVGWSAWCAYAVWSALRASHPRLALLSWVFPLAMAANVLVTGNHYVLDIVGSGVLLLVSIAAASVWGRLAERWRRARSGIRPQGCTLSGPGH